MTKMAERVYNLYELKDIFEPLGLRVVGWTDKHGWVWGYSVIHPHENNIIHEWRSRLSRGKPERPFRVTHAALVEGIKEMKRRNKCQH